MVCRDIGETISSFVDGEASPEEAGMVREHLASCERCRVLERQMRAVGAGVRQVRGKVPDRFREAVFARLEAEGALPQKREAPARSWRWAAVPLAAAAALGLFLLTSRETSREGAVPGPSTARVETSPPLAPERALPVPGPAAGPKMPPVPALETAVPLSAEDREMLALLDLLEDTNALDADGDAEGMDLLAPGESPEPPIPTRGGRSGA